MNKLVSVTMLSLMLGTSFNFMYAARGRTGQTRQENRQDRHTAKNHENSQPLVQLTVPQASTSLQEIPGSHKAFACLMVTGLLLSIPPLWIQGQSAAEKSTAPSYRHSVSQAYNNTEICYDLPTMCTERAELKDFSDADVNAYLALSRKNGEETFPGKRFSIELTRDAIRSFAKRTK